MKNLSQSRPARLAAAICVAGLLLTPAQASASKHEPQWLRALELRSDALDRKYHLGRYAHIAPPPPSDRGFDWTAAAHTALTVNRSVRAVPTSTTNITGFFHWMSGRSMTNDCFRAARSSSGASRPALRLARRVSFSSSGDGPDGGDAGAGIVCCIEILL